MYLGLQYATAKRNRDRRLLDQYDCVSLPSCDDSTKDSSTVVTTDLAQKSSKYQVNFKDSSEEAAYLNHIRKLLKAACENHNQCVIATEPIEFVEGQYCHLCRATKDYGVRFSCKLVDHVYCDYHCRTRLGFSAIRHMKENDTSSKLREEEYVSVLSSSPSPSSKKTCIVDQADVLAMQCHEYFDGVCPICSLSCNCSKCTSKLNKILREFKFRSDRDRSKSMEDVNIDVWQLSVGANASKKWIKDSRRKESWHYSYQAKGSKRLEKGSTLSSNDNEGTGEIDKICKRKKERKSLAKEETLHGVTLSDVPKLKVAEIPLEEMPSSSVTSLQDMQSHVGYCMTCLLFLSGDSNHVLNCAQCPRAYHKHCLHRNRVQYMPGGVMASFTSNISSSGIWLCEFCKCSKEQLLASRAFENIKPISVEYPHTLKFNLNQDCPFYRAITITVPWIVQRLIYSHFGHTFQSPVKLRQCPDYIKIVSKPMDYGTVLQNISHHRYIKGIDTCNMMDLALFRVLKDIELIYHNCYMYNRPDGCLLHRMADTQRQLYSDLRRISGLEKLLRSTTCSEHFNNAEIEGGGDMCNSDKANDNLFIRLQHHIENLKKRRGNQRLLQNGDQVPLTISISTSINVIECNNLLLNRFGAKKSSSSRIVVYDHEANEIVRLFSSQKMAMEAILLLQNNHGPHRVGIQPLSDYQLRKIFKASSRKMKLKMFGYRWLLYDDLLQDKLARSSLYNKPFIRLENEALSNKRKIELSGSVSDIQQRRLDVPHMPQESNHSNTFITSEKQFCKRQKLQNHEKSRRGNNVAKISNVSDFFPSLMAKSSIFNDGGKILNTASLIEEITIREDENTSSEPEHGISSDMFKSDPLSSPPYSSLLTSRSWYSHDDDIASIPDKNRKPSLTSLVSTPTSCKRHVEMDSNAKKSYNAASMNVDNQLQNRDIYAQGAHFRQLSKISALPPPGLVNSFSVHGKSCEDIYSLTPFIATGLLQSQDSSLSTASVAQTKNQKFFKEIANSQQVTFETKLIALSLSTQKIIGRWENVQSCANQIGIAGTSIIRLVQERIPQGDVLFARAHDEMGLMEKVREIVARGGKYVPLYRN